MVADRIASGALVEILADRAQPPVPLQLVYPESRLVAPKVRAFIDLSAPRLRAALGKLSAQETTATKVSMGFGRPRKRAPLLALVKVCSRNPDGNEERSRTGATGGKTSKDCVGLPGTGIKWIGDKRRPPGTGVRPDGLLTSRQLPALDTLQA